MRTLAAEFDRLLRARPRARSALARALAARREDWPTWAAQFNRVHVNSPELERQAARALYGAFVASGDRLTAARLLMIEARAIHRCGSPREAAAAFERAARRLAAAGDVPRSVQARVVRVDALAIAGRVDEAIAVGRALAGRLVGAWGRLWRNVLHVNVANALRLRGDLDGALRRYDDAARSFAALGQVEQAAIARMNAGVVLLDAGRGEDALVRFERAAHDFEAAGAADLALEARYNRACALVRAARLGEGVSQLSRLVVEHETRGLRRREALCRMDLADALLRAGDAASARTEAERAASGFAALGAHAERCEALLVAAAATTARSRARSLLRRARAAAVASARPSIVLRCDLILEDARPRGTPPSVARVTRIARRADAMRQTEIAALARLLLGEASLDAGDAAGAAARFRRALRASTGRPWIRAAAVGGLATCLARQGRRRRALAALRGLAAFLETVRVRLPGPWLRTTFVLRRLDPTLARVELLLAGGDADERTEAEALLDSIAARRFRERAAPREARARSGPRERRLDALYDRIGRGVGPTRGLSDAELARVEAEARDLERGIAESWRASERTGPVRRGGRVVRLASTPLRATEAAYHVWVANGRVRALVRRGPRVEGDADLGAVHELAEEVERVGFLADRVRLFGPRGTSLALADRLASLGGRMLAPIAAVDGATALHLVLDPEVPDVPWECLSLGGVRLSTRFALLRTPSLRRRRVAAARGPTTFVAAGEESLPGIGRELARLAPGARVVVGRRATRRALSAALARPGVVQIAGHGLASAEAPGRGGVRLADDWFTPLDVPPRVRADVVVLAACRGGIERGVAAQAWGALPIALLAAGARRVIWSPADVDDEAVADVIPRFLRHARRASPEVAFGRALADAGNDARVAACMLPLRLSGVRT